MSPRYYGSTIGLRPEYAERYRVLHRHTFPGVLERIARSNIRNYSIYLHGHVLFSHLEYVGHDYDADMAAIAADETTRDWWQLTDPMQCAFDDRAPGEWWMRLPRVRGDREDGPFTPPSPGTIRCAMVATAAAPVRQAGERGVAGARGSDVSKLRVFRWRDQLFIYAESDVLQTGRIAERVTTILGLVTVPALIEEVFHTDGAPPANALTMGEGNSPDAGPTHARKVFVSGCFDMLHSGHVAFLKEAARHGKLHVGIGSDATIYQLKGRYTVNSQDERKYMIEALDCVEECRVNRGSGFLDFEEDLRDLRPDVLLVNEDGHSPAKEALCRSLGIEYRVLQRVPHPGLPARNTTTLRTESRIPFRIDLAGGWLDQPYVSCHHPGAVLTISIEPTIEFNDRSGMASSTRRKAVDLWRTTIPHGDPEQLAKVLFSYENPPGTKEVAGSQDALGIVLPGLNRLYYDGEYWPRTIESVHDDEMLSWLEARLHLLTLGPRVNSFRVLDDVRVDRDGARALAAAAEDCWRAILARDARGFGEAFTRSFEAQVSMFPLMADAGIRQTIDEYRERALGWKLSGAGGGGYLILVAEEPVPNTLGVKIRRRGMD